MTHRALLTSLGLAAALCAVPAAAQQAGTVARLSGLEGSVMVSQGDGMAAATNGQRVGPGARVLTLGGAKVTINYDVGCDISLKENQRFTVRLGECGALLSEVVSVGPVVAAGPLAGVSTVGIVGGSLITIGLGYGIYETFRNNPSVSVSPN